jgi:hypothetical protein
VKDNLIKVASSSVSTEIPDKRLAVDFGLALLAALIMVVAVLLWFSFDYRIPTQDEAGHVFNSIALSNLLAQCRLWQLHWWRECLTITPFYPPFVYLVNGVGLLLFGASKLTEHCCMAFFSAILMLAVYMLTRLLKGGRLAALLGGFVLSAYPIISWLSHTFFLELPAVAMTALALAIILWWRNQTYPSTARTTLCGLGLGAACLTKQMVAAYILPLVFYFIISDSITAAKQRGKPASVDSVRWIIHDFIAVTVALVSCLPYLLVSFSTHKIWLTQNINTFASAGIHHSFLGNASFYLGILPMLMTPVLLFMSILSLAFFRSRDYRNLLPVIISAIGGFCLTCTSMGTDLEVRYGVPFLIGPAVFTAVFLEKLLMSSSLIKRIASIIGMCLVLATYLSFNFVPYPIALRPLPWVTGWFGKPNGNPTPYADWGQSFVVDEITKVDAGKPIFLNLLPNHDAVNVNSFRLWLWEQGNHSIYPTSSRTWTIVGDHMNFDPKAVCDSTWFLVKTGDTGFHLDAQSVGEYEKLLAFIHESGKYKLMATKSLPDSSELMLYRRTF